MTRWRGSKKEAPAPRHPTKDNPKTVTSAPIIPQDEDPRYILYVLNQMVEAFDTLDRADALGCDPGGPMSVLEALEIIYGDDWL